MLKRLKLILLVMPLLLLFSCSDIDGLNDYNAVFSFEITDHKGESGDIEIGDAVMLRNTVSIPVIHGVHNFPLYIKGTPKFENPIDRVTGIDFSDWVVIDLRRDANNEPMLDDKGNYIFEEPKFYVQALSGMPREYTIKIDYKSMSNDANVYREVKFKDLPEGLIVAGIATVIGSETSGESNKIMINVANPVFPLTLTPEFSIGDGASLEGNGTTKYVFKNTTETHNLTVVARDGSRKDWIVSVNSISVVNENSADINPAVLELTNLSEFTVVPLSKGFAIEEYNYSSSKKIAVSASKKMTVRKTVTSMVTSGVSEGYMAADTLKLYISTTSSNPFPLTLAMEIPGYEGVSVNGLSDVMTFADMDAVNEFYMVDTGNGIARRWVVALEKYESPTVTVESVYFDYSASTVKKKFGGQGFPAIVFDKDVEIDHVARKVYLKATEVNNSDSHDLVPWKLTTSFAINVSAGGKVIQAVNPSYSGNDSWKEPRKFKISASDGTEYEWTIVIRDWRNGEPAPSDECSLYGVAINQLRPYIAQYDTLEPYVIDQENKTVTLNITKDENAYPLSVAMDYTISDFARITTQSGGQNPLVFNSASSVNKVVIESESGNRRQEWMVKLRLPLKESGTDVTSFQITSFSDAGFGGEVVGIDSDNAVIKMNFTQVGSFPVTMNVRMGISYKAVSSIADEAGYGSVVFSKIENKTFTVTAQNGDSRTWTIKAEYLPQLQNANFELWKDTKTPLPKGAEGSPYWSSANMNVMGISVSGTTKTDGMPGQGKAVQLKTGSTVGKLASGSLFLGWFDSSNPIGNMNDPTVMTFQGIPFSASRKIKGFQADICYHPGGGASSDAGSMTIELVKQRNTAQRYEYHGFGTDGNWHSKNNADMVAHGKHVVAIQSGKLDNGDTATLVVKDNVWETVFVPLSYEGNYPDYTHLSIICGSSSQGDSFKGTEGSTLKIDNIRLIYEE